MPGTVNLALEPTAGKLVGPRRGQITAVLFNGSVPNCLLNTHLCIYRSEELLDLVRIFIMQGTVVKTNSQPVKNRELNSCGMLSYK